jgi:hypothetical protein
VSAMLLIPHNAVSHLSLQFLMYSYVTYNLSVTLHKRMLYIFSCIVCVCGLNYEQVVTISSFKGIPMTAVNPGEDGMVVFSQMTLEDLLAEVRQYLSPQDVESIQRAYTEASRAHLGTLRRSGEPFIQHPLEVARLLADMRIDADGIVAALLHDVVEDTDFT